MTLADLGFDLSQPISDKQTATVLAAMLTWSEKKGIALNDDQILDLIAIVRRAVKCHNDGAMVGLDDLIASYQATKQ